jgi:hypothetical protein
MNRWPNWSAKLAATAPLYLLSNTNDMHVEALLRDFEVFAHFSGATYSHEARASKPHKRIYEIACERHGLVPAETLFVDDLAANISAAVDLGFKRTTTTPITTTNCSQARNGVAAPRLRAPGGCRMLDDARSRTEKTPPRHFAYFLNSHEQTKHSSSRRDSSGRRPRSCHDGPFAWPAPAAVDFERT